MRYRSEIVKDRRNCAGALALLFSGVVGERGRNSFAFYKVSPKDTSGPLSSVHA